MIDKIENMINEIPATTLRKLDTLSAVIETGLNQIIHVTEPITDFHIHNYEAKWPLSEQYLKIHEETSEAYKSFYRKLDNEDEEHMDLLFSLLTLYHLRDKTRKSNQDAIKTCLLKFHRRGWI